jgi:hypothetical protein
MEIATQNNFEPGKIHLKLKLRLWLLGIIAVGTAGILVYDILFKNLHVIPVLGFAVFGYILGYFVFTHMNKLEWIEEEEVVNIGKFDAVSFCFLAIYVIYRVLIEMYLAREYTNGLMASGYGLATLFGGMAGRLAGMLVKISRIHRENA